MFARVLDACWFYGRVLGAAGRTFHGMLSLRMLVTSATLQCLACFDCVAHAYAERTFPVVHASENDKPDLQ